MLHALIIKWVSLLRSRGSTRLPHHKKKERQEQGQRKRCPVIKVIIRAGNSLLLLLDAINTQRGTLRGIQVIDIR